MGKGKLSKFISVRESTGLTGTNGFKSYGTLLNPYFHFIIKYRYFIQLLAYIKSFASLYLITGKRKHKSKNY